MSESLQVLAVILGISLTWMLVSFKFNLKEAVKYFQSEVGKTAGIGILLALTFLVVLCVAPNAFGERDKIGYLNYAEVYFGLDHTNKLSPQCWDSADSNSGSIDDRTTSNFGLRVNLLESPSKRGYINTKYQHHSCAFNRDREQYDAFGFEGGWRFYTK